MRASFLVPVAVAALVTTIAAPAHATQGPIQLDDLAQRPAVQPSTFMVSGHLRLHGLQWSGWGTRTAVGRGTMRIDTCSPNCAQGDVRVVPNAELQVTGVRTDEGRRYYRQYRIVGSSLTPLDRAALSQWTPAYAPSDFR